MSKAIRIHLIICPAGAAIFKLLPVYQLSVSVLKGPVSELSTP
jgi:hypothetical protein